METQPKTYLKNGQKRKSAKIAELFNRAKNCRRRVFTISEDKIIIKCASSSRFNNDWESVAKRLYSRTARQCRERWLYYLSPTNNLEPFSLEEDQLVVQKVNELGKKWTQISKFFNGRSENSIKNRWYSKLSSRCNVDPSGIYSLDLQKMVDLPVKPRKSQNLTQNIQITKEDVNNKVEIKSSDFFEEFPFASLTEEQNENNIQLHNDNNLWDGEFIFWTNDVFNKYVQPEFEIQ